MLKCYDVPNRRHHKIWLYCFTSFIFWCHNLQKSKFCIVDLWWSSQTKYIYLFLFFCFFQNDCSRGTATIAFMHTSSWVHTLTKGKKKDITLWNSSILASLSFQLAESSCWIQEAGSTPAASSSLTSACDDRSQIITNYNACK